MVSLDQTKVLYFVALVVSVALSMGGCSISTSAGSISESGGSIANSSESISDSSASSSKTDEKEEKTDEKRYESEVQDFTVTYIRTNSGLEDQNGFMKGISDVASQYGIVDWEANPKTYRGIGKGMKKANVSGIQYDSYKNQLSNGDKGKMDDIQEGYGN